MKQPKQIFSYYGSKSKITKHYPAPKHNLIIEPFAGTAAYAQRYWDKKVFLVDAYPVIVELWRWIIDATKDDVLALPDIDRETRVKELDIPVGAKHLIGFWANQGSASPGNVPTQWTTLRRVWAKSRSAIADIVHRFNHWEVYNGSYTELSDCETPATWFVDPPYVNGGQRYVKNNIDYNHLAQFCRSRNGQVIVCENGDASWLPFRPLCELSGQRKKTTEVVWMK